MTDEVNRPKHYTAHPSGVECIQVTEHMGFNLGNAIKYVWRADLKGNAVQDLKKAAWYIEREIKRRETKQQEKTMPNTYRQSLQAAWNNPDYGIYDPFDPEYNPTVNLLFERGFRAAWQHAEQAQQNFQKVRDQRDASYQREHQLLSLLAELSHYIYAQQGAEHMLDGFNPHRREPIDTQVERLKHLLNPDKRYGKNGAKP